MAVLNTAAELEVVGEASGAEEAVTRAARLQPDVVVMDTRVLGSDEITTVERLRDLAVPPKILILSTHGQYDRFRPVLRAGAASLISRDAQPDQLLTAIAAVAAGHLVWPPCLPSRLFAEQTVSAPLPASGTGTHKAPERADPAASSVRAEPSARDFHDLLGRSLAALNRKSELVAQLLPDQPERARAELEAVCVFARRSISEVRALARGHRLGELSTEIEEIRSDLEMMGVSVEVIGALGALPKPVQDTFGWVAREAAANIIHHSDATTCSIDVWTTRWSGHLRIVNDGVREQGAQDGTGLAGLTGRLQAIGGTLAHGLGPDLTYYVEATAPLDW
ncbi:response regulator [Actinocorallia sp. API 0066]|uniref:response regulator n=1 Tax=Actinocorallia sp. API 0066 TaxID=2896846 RepID=UPI001E3F617F|nr:histidine kinase [Actinocorallia sp. API 0066]MCD0448641.1 response regulator [Actinocorallia sp. API 0066]